MLGGRAGNRLRAAASLRKCLRIRKRPLPNPRASDVEEYCNYNQSQASTGCSPERGTRPASPSTSEVRGSITSSPLCDVSRHQRRLTRVVVDVLAVVVGSRAWVEDELADEFAGFFADDGLTTSRPATRQ